MIPSVDPPRVVVWQLTPPRAPGGSLRPAARDPLELTARERRQVVRALARSRARPPVVLAVGDPAERPDFDAIVEQLVDRGFPTVIAPGASVYLSSRAIRHWADMGVAGVALKLDGATASAHDRFAGAPGTYAATLVLARAAVARGMRLTVRSMATRFSAPELPGLSVMVAKLSATTWVVQFPIPRGRLARSLPMGAPRQARVVAWLAACAAQAPFEIMALGAPHLIRLTHPKPDGQTVPAIRDGQGLVYIDHRGQVCPSADLPLSAGSAVQRSALSLYRDAPLFRSLRDPARLGGRCGTCVWHAVCGGSRARAYAATGSAWAEDPHCLAQWPS